jgi:hypothetical protein
MNSALSIIFITALDDRVARRQAFENNATASDKVSEKDLTSLIGTITGWNRK